jgi:hypothetical protein
MSKDTWGKRRKKKEDPDRPILSSVLRTLEEKQHLNTHSDQDILDIENKRRIAKFPATVQVHANVLKLTCYAMNEKPKLKKMYEKTIILKIAAMEADTGWSAQEEYFGKELTYRIYPKTPAAIAAEEIRKAALAAVDLGPAFVPAFENLRVDDGKDPAPNPSAQRSARPGV